MKRLKSYKALSKKTIIIVLAVTVVTVSIGYTSINVAKSNKENSELVSREREYVVKKGDITAGTDGSGILKFEQVNQNFEESVVIEEIFVKEGQRIKKGDKIASVSEEFINDKLKELNNQLQQASESLKSAKSNKQATILTQNKAWEDRIQATKNQYENQKTSIESSINTLSEKLIETDKKISQVRAQIEELSKSPEENSIKLQELKLSESTLISEKENIERELQVAKESLAVLNDNRQNELNSEEKDLQANNEINNLSNCGLDSSISSLQREVDRINEQIAKVEKLKETSILYAEIDGVVLTVGYTNGATTMIDNPVITIGENNKVLAEIVISQSDITKIEEGQDAYIIVTAFQDEKFTGKVKYINLKPNNQGNTTNYSVIVELDANEYNLLDGMTATAQFVVKEVKDVLMLSNRAITLKDGKQIVKVKQEDKTLKEVEITTGFSDGKNTEILSGLSEDDTVVIGGQ